MKIKLIIMIYDYEISIIQALDKIKIDMNDVSEITFILDYLHKDNKYRIVTFQVENGIVDLKRYTYGKN